MSIALVVLAVLVPGVLPSRCSPQIVSLVPSCTPEESEADSYAPDAKQVHSEYHEIECLGNTTDECCRLVILSLCSRNLVSRLILILPT